MKYLFSSTCFILLMSAFLLALLFSVGCDTIMYLSPDETWNRNISVCKKGNTEKLILSGLCSNSSWGVDKLNIEKKKEKLFFQILLKPQKNGNFKYEIVIDKDINYIFWDKTMVWERNQGLIPIK